MSNVYDFSLLPEGNKLVGNIKFDGQNPPSVLNNSFRETMAAIAKYLRQVGGVIVGEISSLEANSNIQIQLDHDYTNTVGGVLLRFRANNNAVGNVTLSINGTKIKSFVMDSPSGVIPVTNENIKKHGIYTVIYFNNDLCFLENPTVITREPNTVAPSNELIEAPVGTVSLIARPKIPEGWLYCNGSAVSRADHNKLFEVIGTMYGEGDKKTTFNLPNYRGVFLIGDIPMLPSGERFTPKYTSDTLHNHIHTTELKAMARAHMVNNLVKPGWPAGSKKVGNGYNVSYDLGLVDKVDGNALAETRPANIALKYIIKR